MFALRIGSTALLISLRARRVISLLRIDLKLGIDNARSSGGVQLTHLPPGTSNAASASGEKLTLLLRYAGTQALPVSQPEKSFCWQDSTSKWLRR